MWKQVKGRRFIAKNEGLMREEERKGEERGEGKGMMVRKLAEGEQGRVRETLEGKL